MTDRTGDDRSIGGPVESPGTPGFRWAMVLSAIALLAGLFGAWVRPVWHDELYTLYLARLPLGDLLAALKADSGPPLHYLICRLLYGIVGWQEGSAVGTWIVRLPSVVAFSALPMVVWRWGRGRQRFWGPLLVVSWLPLLYFATEARTYALLALANAVVWLLGPDLVSVGGSRLAAFVITAAALPMLHYTGIVSFVFLPLLVFWIPAPDRRAFFSGLAVAAVPLLAWAPIILGAPNQSMSWVDTLAGPGRPGVASVQVVSPAGPFPALFEAPHGLLPAGVSLAALFLLVIGCAVGVVAHVRRPSRPSHELRELVRPALGLLPTATLVGMALAGVPVYFAGRTESMVWALAVGVVVVGLCSGPRWVRIAAVTPYLMVGLVSITQWLFELPSHAPPNGIQVAHAMAPELRDRDLIVVAGLWQLEVRHGLAEAAITTGNGVAARARVRTIPQSQADHPGWFDRDAFVPGQWILELEDLRQRADQDESRIWLIWSPGLPIEHNLKAVFVGWRHIKMVDDEIIQVDFLAPPGPVAGAPGSHQP